MPLVSWRKLADRIYDFVEHRGLLILLVPKDAQLESMLLGVLLDMNGAPWITEFGSASFDATERKGACVLLSRRGADNEHVAWTQIRSFPPRLMERILRGKRSVWE